MKSRALLIFSIFVFSTLPVPNVSANSDVYLGMPDHLDCLSDSIIECALPIDSALTHSWSFVAQNGQVEEEYTFKRNIFDENTSNNVKTDSTLSMVMAPYSTDTVSFTPWNGWIDGHSYNISFYAIRSDGSDVGNVRYFHATFVDQIDVAILSSSSYRVSAIKEDISLLGLKYTQYEIDDWTEYLDSGWLSHYDKIVMPWQEDNAAKPTSQGGDGYYEMIGLTSNKNTLENFMYAGGTLQVHLSSSTPYYEYSSSTGESLLPFDMEVLPRETSEKITYNNMEVADPYHPILDGVDLSAFQGFDWEGTVARAVINTKNARTSSIPSACNGYSEEGGFFQRLLQSQDDPQDTVLGICSYGYGGLLVTTIDVADVSERADSTTFPLLGNMLSYSVSPYPSGFATLGNGLDLTINGNVPNYDPSTGGYAYNYMKSNSQITFGYLAGFGGALSHDWVISGPTDWAGGSMASGTDHTNVMNPNTIFCKADSSSETGCKQQVMWEITLYLHDESGNCRTISVIVETDDARADEFRPVAHAEVEMRSEYIDQIEDRGFKTVSGIDWPLYRIYLDETGSLTVHFDASNSSDADASEGNGIQSYQWRVLFDKPYNEDHYNLEGHTFHYPSTSDGAWAYTFSNITIDPSGQTEAQIRIELEVYDYAGKFSEGYKMYFSVVPEGFGESVVVQTNGLLLNGTDYGGDSIRLIGSSLSASLYEDIYIEMAFDEAHFNESAVVKYALQLEGKWAKATLSDGNFYFDLTLSLADLYDNETKNVRVFWNIYQGDDKSWSQIYWIDVTLLACQGIQLPVEVLAAEPDAYWIWRNNQCEWSGKYIDSNGDGIPDSPPDFDGDGVWDDDDAFPNNPEEWNDTDGDGAGDNSDVFPNDANETLDSDMDGVGDNADVFPNDANETIDTDKDGVGDNADAFPEDANETLDTDGDGVGDNADDFPENAAETKDSDQNGVGDNYQKQLEDEIAANSRNNLILIGSIFSIIAIIVAAVYVVKRKEPVSQKLDVIGDGLLNSQSLPNPTSVVQQWTDDSGYTWRLMDDGKTEWWNGTDWQKV